MADRQPEDLLKLAQGSSKKLSGRERREVIKFLNRNPEATDKDYDSNVALAALFKVSEATIRGDKKAILLEYAGAITPEHAMQFVGEHLLAHDKLIQEAERAFNLMASDPDMVGGQAYRELIKIISDLWTRRTTLLQGIGVVPKELGRLNVTDEEWIAEVDADGVTSLRQGTTAAAPPQQESEDE